MRAKHKGKIRLEKLTGMLRRPPQGYRNCSHLRGRTFHSPAQESLRVGQGIPSRGSTFFCPSYHLPSLRRIPLHPPL